VAKKMLFKMNYGSHLPVLMKVMSLTSGPVVELGGGLYSTPYLHWDCFRQGRELVTYESDPRFFDTFKQYNRGSHKVILVEDWDKVDLSRPWSVGFVDHSPGSRRGKDLARLAHVEYAIAHDAMNPGSGKYGYDEGFKAFKWVWRLKRVISWTAVCSNVHDLRRFKVAP